MEKIKEIAKIIDHTNIDPNATKKDILKTCQEAKKYNFRGVCVRLKWVKLVSKELKGTGIKTIALIDPPIGDSPHKKRVKMCKKAKKDGADELDVVMSIPDAKHGRWEKILKDLKEICKILPTKVIIGSGYLTDKEIIKASQIVKKSRGNLRKNRNRERSFRASRIKRKILSSKTNEKRSAWPFNKSCRRNKNIKRFEISDQSRCRYYWNKFWC